MKRLAQAWPLLLAFGFGLVADLFIRNVIAQPTTPGVVPGCVYNVTPPTLTTGQQSVLQCDVNGRLKVTTS